ncbi:MAG: ABC transporter substrate-binding protein [Rufibacter sp.]
MISFDWNKIIFRLLVLGLCSGFWACEPQKTPSADAATHQTVTDDLGREVTLPLRPRRIMGLDAAMTEMLFAVADTATIVGRTQHCDYPAAVLKKPVVNNYPMDYERLLALKPDAVFATEGIILGEVVAQIQKLGIPVYVQAYDSVSDVLRGVRVLGNLLQRKEQADTLANSLQKDLNQLRGDTAQLKGKTKVLGVIWQDPIYVFGRNTIFTDKLRYIGADNAVPEAFKKQSPALTREYILKINPDVILGGTFEEYEKTFFTLYPELRRIKAYQNRRVFPVTDDLMSRPSPRVVASIEELKRLVR